MINDEGRWVWSSRPVYRRYTRPSNWNGRLAKNMRLARAFGRKPVFQEKDRTAWDGALSESHPEWDFQPVEDLICLWD